MDGFKSLVMRVGAVSAVRMPTNNKQLHALLLRGLVPFLAHLFEIQQLAELQPQYFDSTFFLKRRVNIILKCTIIV